MMKIAAVSMRIKQGRCEENVRQMMRCIEEAKQEGAQLIVFPQNAVSGLQLGEMWLDDDFCRYADSFNARIAALADTIAIVWGNVRYRGSRRFNTAFFAYRGQLELRVKKIDGALENEARYFNPLDIGELIEYGGELIALGFHDQLIPATLNITLDLSDRSISPRGASQLYVNGLSLLEDSCGPKLSDGRCFCVRRGRLVHFSEHAQGCHYFDLDGAQTDRPQPVPLFRRMEMLVDALIDERGPFCLWQKHPESLRLARLLQRPELLEEAPMVYGTQNDDPAHPSLFSGFTLPQLIEAGIYDSLEEAGRTRLYADLYRRTRSLRGVCRELISMAGSSPVLQAELSDPQAFVQDLLARMIPLLRAYDELCLSEEYVRYLSDDLRSWLGRQDR